MTTKNDTIPAPPLTEPQHEPPDWGPVPAAICLVCDGIRGNHDRQCPLAAPVNS